MATFKSNVQTEMERGNYKTFIRKAIYLYGDSVKGSLQRFLVQTYCTVNMKEDLKMRWQEDSLISVEPYSGEAAPLGYERGVRVLGSSPIIPVGDTRVGYNTVTKKVVFLGDVIRLRMASKLKREDRYCRVYVIDSCNAQRADVSLDLGIKEMGFNDEWEVVKREAKGKIDFLPNTTVDSKSRPKRTSERKEREAERVVPRKMDATQKPENPSIERDNMEKDPLLHQETHNIEKWIDAGNNEIEEARSVYSTRSSCGPKKSALRVEKNMQLILRVLNQCMLSLDETTLHKVSTRLSMDTEAEKYLAQRMKEEGYGKKEYIIMNIMNTGNTNVNKTSQNFIFLIFHNF